MHQTEKFTTGNMRRLGADITALLASDRYPVTPSHGEIQLAMPTILKALGIAMVTHTCRDGRGPVYGRLAPAGECQRCDELRAGEAPRPAPAAVRTAANRRQDTGGYPTTEEIADHFRPGGPHASGQCGPVCTFGDY